MILKSFDNGQLSIQVKQVESSNEEIIDSKQLDNDPENEVWFGERDVSQYQTGEPYENKNEEKRVVGSDIPGHNGFEVKVRRS